MAKPLLNSCDAKDREKKSSNLTNEWWFEIKDYRSIENLELFYGMKLTLVIKIEIP